MTKLSRRLLARYAAQELLAGQSTPQLAKHLAGVLVNSKRAGEAELLLADIAWELEKYRKLVQIEVTTAAPLSAELREELNRQIKKVTKVPETILRERVDKSVIGGVRIETAARIWDKTVARRLNDLKGAYK